MDALLFLTGWVFWLLSEIKKKFAMFLFCEYIETHVSYIRGLVSGDWLVTFNLPNTMSAMHQIYPLVAVCILKSLHWKLKTYLRHNS